MTTTDTPIAEIKVGKRHRKDLGDIRSLADSISTVGLLHPIVITPENVLIAGERRIAACRILDWTEIPVRVVDIKSIALGEQAENTQRKDFTPSEAVAVGRAVEKVEKPAAKKRQGTRTDLQPCGNLPQSRRGKTRDKVAKAVGMSGRTYEKAEAIVEAAETEPDKYTTLVEEMDRTGRVSGVHKKLKRMQQTEVIEQEPPPLPTGPFRVIVIDPPWRYDNRASDSSHRAANPYPSMTIDEIKLLPVDELTCENSILWLWTTNAHLPRAFGIVEAWNFQYKTMLTWIKNRMGTGDWLRGKTEHCLMCVKGKPVVNLTNQTTALEGKMREHSRKPDEFYAMVEQLCPGSKVELFTREQCEGWTHHGDEVDKFNASE